MAYITTTEPAYYLDHDSDALRSIIKRYSADGAYIAANSGADHPLAIECLAIANAAWFVLVIVRKESNASTPGEVE